MILTKKKVTKLIIKLMRATIRCSDSIEKHLLLKIYLGTFHNEYISRIEI